MRNFCFTVLCSLSVSGCADYLNHNDCVTLACGDAQKANMLLQTANPFNPDSANTRFASNGPRAVSAVRSYQNGLAGQGGGGASGGGNCDVPGQTAADGSRCGNRAASVQ